MKMEAKLKLVFRCLFLASPLLLTSCNNGLNNYSKIIYCFDTFLNVSYQGNKDILDTISNLSTSLSDDFDAYKEIVGKNNLHALNNASSTIEISEDLAQILDISLQISGKNNLFNPLIKNLSDLWKINLESKKIPKQEDISACLFDINSSNISLNNKLAKINGDAKIDLGAIAKGYLIDKLVPLMKDNVISSYILNAGTSSIALGKKDSNDGFYTVGIEHFNNAYLKLKETSLSTSSIYKQGVLIDGTTYSHIINPVNGSAINNFDLVVALGDNATYLDAVSTIAMLSNKEDLSKLETDFSCKLLAFKNNEIAYKNEGITIYYA